MSSGAGIGTFRVLGGLDGLAVLDTCGGFSLRILGPAVGVVTSGLTGSGTTGAGGSEDSARDAWSKPRSDSASAVSGWSVPTAVRRMPTSSSTKAVAATRVAELLIQHGQIEQAAPVIGVIPAEVEALPVEQPPGDDSGLGKFSLGVEPHDFLAQFDRIALRVVAPAAPEARFRINARGARRDRGSDRFQSRSAVGALPPELSAEQPQGPVDEEFAQRPGAEQDASIAGHAGFQLPRSRRRACKSR